MTSSKSTTPDGDSNNLLKLRHGYPKAPEAMSQKELLEKFALHAADLAAFEFGVAAEVATTQQKFSTAALSSLGTAKTLKIKSSECEELPSEAQSHAEIKPFAPSKTAPPPASSLGGKK
jgi:hypothetical protein